MDRDPRSGASRRLQASRNLAELADLDIVPEPVERIVRLIGQERIDQRDAAVAAYQRLPLMAKDVVANPNRRCPSVAMVSVDGGRVQMRADPSKESECERTTHWRDSKVALLKRDLSQEHQVDPDPHVPAVSSI